MRESGGLASERIRTVRRTGIAQEKRISSTPAFIGTVREVSGVFIGKKHMPLRIIFTLLALIVVFGSIAFFLSTRGKGGLWEGSEGKVRIAATFYPLGFLAKEIGGDAVFVRTIVPFGIEPHDFDPPFRDIADIRNAQLFLVNGAGFDTWANNIVPALSSEGVRALVATDEVGALSGIGDDENGETGVDPHFWLDPKRFETFGRAVLNELVRLDPANASIYRKNFASFEKNIRSIDRGYADIGKGLCRKKTVIVSHNAFSYLANREHFSILSLSGLSPEVEVSARHIADIVRRAKMEGVHFVLLEPLSNPAAVEAVAREIGAEILPMNPIEGLTKQEIAEEKNYFSLQAENLISLRRALECE